MILTRALSGLLAMIALLCLSFVLMRVLPGDPALMFAGDFATTEQIEQIREQMGLDKPLPTQLWDYGKGVLQGDLGQSLRTRRPVVVEINTRVGRTLLLAVTSMTFAVALAAILSGLSTYHAGKTLDRILSGLSILAGSVPVYWSGAIAVALFSVNLGWFPTGGGGTWRHLILPAVTLGIYQAGPLALLMRASMLDVASGHHIRTAKGKGASRLRIYVRHIGRLVLIPVTAMVSIQFGRTIGSAVVTETVFSWAGLGRLLVEAAQSQDLPIVQGLLLVFGLVFVSANVLAEILYTLLDPRIRVR